MTSEHIKRQLLIDENIPKLIKSLTGFKQSDENYRLCEEYAFSRAATHNYLSTNSHEVRRRVDGLAERFMADNYTRYGERLKELVNKFVNDPLCTNHYELDVQWSVLQFLLDVSKNPVAALAENKEKIQIEDPISDDDAANVQQDEMIDDLMHSLLQTNITPEVTAPEKKLKSSADESDLSDWSDEGDEDESSEPNRSSEPEHLSFNKAPISLKLIRTNSSLRPPQKLQFYTAFDSKKAPEWKEKNTQSSWWLNKNDRIARPGVRTDESVPTLSEWCLMREIIWMLKLEPHHDPSNSTSSNEFSKFFTLNTETDNITVNRDISLVNVSIDGIQTILNEFAEAMTISYSFRKFFENIFQHTNAVSFFESTVYVPPYTIQCYANGLKEFLNVVAESITKLETELIEQDPMEIRTIIYMYNELLPYFRLLRKLFDIHQKVFIDFKTTPGHITVAHLLAGLIEEMNTTALSSRLNLATSLLLVSMRFYFNIFNGWWNEGRFDDWRNEFLVQKSLSLFDNPTTNIYQLQIIPSDITRSIQATIENCDIVKLLRTESMEAGYIVNILYNLGKLNEMKEISNMKYEDLGDLFMKNLWTELNKMKKETASDGVEHENLKSNPIEESAEEIPEALSMDYHELDNEEDPLLRMVFEQFLPSSIENQSADDHDEENEDENLWSSYQIFKRLSEVTDFPMPMSIIIQNCIKEMLRSRIAVANAHVLRIYRDEFKVIDHIKNVQRVFLLGAGDLMLTFYSNLFKSMNDGENWNNSYLLTVQLDNILTTKYPEMHSMFSIQLTANDSHAKTYLNAIKDITINYVVRDCIRDVIHEKCLSKYNAIFRFLLQIKWAIWTLETLRFPIAFKKRRPYQPLTMIDLIFKRLALMRNWVIYSIQCIHSHLMTFVIQSMGQQFFKKMEKVECLRGIIELHDSYIDTIYQHCFRKSSDVALRTGVEQLLNLVMVLHDEWNNLKTLDSDGDYIDGENELDVSGTVQQLDIVESTYIDCHCYIDEVLSREVYTKNRADLASLSAAFQCSRPY